MKHSAQFLYGALLLAMTSGCSIKVGGDFDNPRPENRSYEVTNLVSDRAGLAEHVDPALVNPWGLAFGPDTFFWVANEGTSTSTLYDGDGGIHNDELGGPVSLPTPLRPSVEGSEPVEGGPTGLVFNGGDGFALSAAGRTGPSRFLFATLAGTIIGWAPEIATRNGVIAIDSMGTTVYTGLAIADSGTGAWLYAADFAGAKIDVFDESFGAITNLAAGAFVDPDLPAGYAPFGVHAIDDRIYVAYAQQDPDTGEEAAGRGLGYVSVFDVDGMFVARVASQGDLNAPWAVTRAPEEFGRFSEALLIGNFGDGRITAYDDKSYEPLGQLENTSGATIAIEGLWALSFGNDRKAGESDDLYFTAGIDDETHGLFGEIGVAGKEE